MTSKDDTLKIQNELRTLGLYKGNLDGDYGPQTKAAVEAFQRLNSLAVDGVVGPKTWAELFDVDLPIRSYVPPFPAPKAATVWPRQVEVMQFFGPPASKRCTAGKVTLPFAFRIAWDLDDRVNSFSCHDQVAPAMTHIWHETAAHYGENQMRALRLDLFGGCYNPRKMRGGTSWSMHAYGIAYDVDPEHNQLKWTRDLASLDAAVYDPFWRIVESTGAISLGRVANYDWMHFQFARL